MMDNENPSERLFSGPDDPEVLRACGLPVEPTADVRDAFYMAVNLIRRGQYDSNAAAAVALATAIGQAGGQNVYDLPFGYSGPRVEHKGWLRRNDLTRWLTQLGGLVPGGRFNADSARLAIEYALSEYWLQVKQFDEWRPGMRSGSGWIDIIHPEVAGIARATQMAAEPATTFSQVQSAPSTPPWKSVTPIPPLEPANDAASDATDEATIAAPSTKKTKRSTERGEGQRKLIGALTKHHQYADGGCLNLDPIGNNELARLAEVSESTASTFFKQQFKGYTKYRMLCGDASRLVAALKLLNQEFSPYHLFGSTPPGERDRNDDK